MKKLIERLRQYSESLVAYKLSADFADAVNSAADMLENHASDRAAMVAEIEKLRKQLEQTHADRDAAIAGQETLQKAMAECKAERDVLRNELCYLCGKYRDAHNGACDGCRWKEA